MSRLLVPLDTSDSAAGVLQAAIVLGLSLDAELDLFHVVEPMATYIPVAATMDVITTGPTIPDADFLAAGQVRLEHLAATARAAGLTVNCDTIIGLPAEEITEKATTLGSDYIVLGSHGHGAIFHLLSGSVVTGVLKHSPCPVLVVPIRASSR